MELNKEFAEIIGLQMGNVGILHLRGQLLNDLLGAVLVHSNRITAQELFLFWQERNWSDNSPFEVLFLDWNKQDAD